ncbi:hypothetical protein TNCT_716421 [Trichonephila clavata]|uniref:Uncharacterized protein n=1 Tax=Trichonephila clavata TaxID=2740835 RepID=A0A8X6LN82_TRICU|nr:hypothetical protein TNCT_716421 [Trichonephila clavata]
MTIKDTKLGMPTNTTVTMVIIEVSPVRIIPKTEQQVKKLDRITKKDGSENISCNFSRLSSTFAFSLRISICSADPNSTGEYWRTFLVSRLKHEEQRKHKLQNKIATREGKVICARNSRNILM